MVMRKRSRRRNPYLPPPSKRHAAINAALMQLHTGNAIHVKGPDGGSFDMIISPSPSHRPARESYFVQTQSGKKYFETADEAVEYVISNLGFNAVSSAARRNPSDLAVREKFDRCVASVRAKSGKRHLTKAGRYARISSPEAVCAASIRRTSRKQLAKISAEGRSLAAARRHARGLVRSRKTGRLVRRSASRLRPTAIQRRHQVQRVMHQQALAKRRAMQNPSGKIHLSTLYDATYKGKRGYVTVAYKNGRKYAVVFSPTVSDAERARELLKNGHKYSPMILRGVVLGREASW